MSTDARTDRDKGSQSRLWYVFAKLAAVRKLRGVGGDAKLLFFTLCDHGAANDEGCFPAQSTLIDDMEKSRRTVQTAIARMIDEGLLWVHNQGSEYPDERMPRRSPKAEQVRANWYVIRWDNVFKWVGMEPGEGATGAPQDAVQPIARSACSGDERASDAPDTHKQGAPGAPKTPGEGATGAHSSPRGRNGRASEAQPTRPEGATGAPRLAHYKSSYSSSPSTPLADAHADDGRRPPSRGVVEGMLISAGIGADTASDLAGLEHVDEDYAGAMIEAVRADATVRSVAAALIHRIEHAQEPSPAGRRAWAAKVDPARKAERLARERRERAERSEAEQRETEATRGEVSAWLDGRTDEQLEAIRSAYLETLDESQARTVRAMRTRGHFVAALLMEFQKTAHTEAVA